MVTRYDRPGLFHLFRWNQYQFNSLEFEGIKNEAGRNSFFLSAKKSTELTEARGLVASAGRYGGAKFLDDGSGKAR